MVEEITFERLVSADELRELLQHIEFRGVYDKDGNPLKPYANAKFSLVSVHPPEHPTSSPKVMKNFQPRPLFTSQPTIYKSQTDMLTIVDTFLQSINKRIHTLGFEGVQYEWKDRGRFHVLPPIIEKHRYPLKGGLFDLKKMRERFKGVYVKDARGKLHELSQKFMRDFYVDKHSRMSYMPVFNHNASLINYGLRFNGSSSFYIVCDGSHRMDYALELLDEPINAILVEGDELLPYYAFPMPFRPTTRLTSKEAEKMYPKLERDKIHLLSDMIRKVLHYNWEAGGLHVSKLRGKDKIF